MIPNHVKQRLRAGKACFGSLLNFGDPLVAELMASAGFARATDSRGEVSEGGQSPPPRF